MFFATLAASVAVMYADPELEVAAMPVTLRRGEPLELDVCVKYRGRQKLKLADDLSAPCGYLLPSAWKRIPPEPSATYKIWDCVGVVRPARCELHPGQSIRQTMSTKGIYEDYVPPGRYKATVYARIGGYDSWLASEPQRADDAPPDGGLFLFDKGQPPRLGRVEPRVAPSHRRPLRSLPVAVTIEVLETPFHVAPDPGAGPFSWLRAAEDERTKGGRLELGATPNPGR